MLMKFPYRCFVVTDEKVPEPESPIGIAGHSAHAMQRMREERETVTSPVARQSSTSL